VLYLSAEDDAARVIRPRLEALEANLAQISILEAKYKIRHEEGKEPLIHFASLSDQSYWQAVFSRIKKPVAIFIDPLPSYMGQNVNDRKNSEVRAVLGPFIDLAVGYGLTVIGITHLGKSIDSSKPLSSRILDSIAYSNLARAVHFVARDPEDHDRKFFLPGPCNYAPGDLEALAFRLRECQIKTEDGETIAVAVAEFEAATVAVRPEDVVQVTGRKKPGPVSRIPLEMAEWLFDRLKDQLPQRAYEIHDDCAAAFAHKKPNPMGVKQENGYWSHGRNLRRAAECDLPKLPYPRNGMVVARAKESLKSSWYWRLEPKPEAATEASQVTTEDANPVPF
jgi:hypothetical protein